ncbi:glutamate 5-kinase [Pseudochelatococcus contaminans]|uniref:Glutamate 5-kinase n=2 Tax=Pseudochelatococcus contaminans TaxID=1538103 RepID=A0A7W5Z5E9_9HYPH|nr:glutamate 5-kinase [Pseudochelatococcus contaminans]
MMTDAVAIPAVSARLPDLGRFRRVVIKVGSSLLVDRERGRLKRSWLAALVHDIARLHEKGTEVIVVSSGAIALGRTVLHLPAGPLRLEESQGAAAVGQIALARRWTEALAVHEIIAGQILLTFSDTEKRRRYLHARATITKLLELRAVPIINENDSVATSEIRYGDNDRLAARVATMVGADLLILLSDVDGLYTAPPNGNPDARHIPLVEEITPAIEAMAGGAASELSRGGMRTKVEAGKIATAGGACMLIADGRVDGPVSAVMNGARGTWFLSPSNPVTARKKWIAGTLQPHGVLHVDAGAERALRNGASLLPAGVRKLEGNFHRGDAVSVRGPDGREIGRGIIGYDADEAGLIAGHSTQDIERLLGHGGRATVIHRDDLVLFGREIPEGALDHAPGGRDT